MSFDGPRRTWVHVFVLVLLAGLAVAAMYTVPSARHVATAPREIAPIAGALALAIGLVVGCYGTVVGIGGGPVIMPVLMSLYGWRTEELVGTCLLVVFLNACSGSIGYALERRVDYVGGLKFSLAAAPGAVIVGFFHHLVGLRFFDVVFGVFLLLLALYCAITIEHVEPQARSAVPAPVPGQRRVHIVDSRGEEFTFNSDDSLGVKVNVALGGVSGLLGIGGGVLQVPTLMYLLRYPPHVATATTHFVTMLTAAAALVPHLILGNIHYGAALWMGIGVVAGAQVGARISTRISSKALVLLFVVVLLGFSARLLLH